MPLEVIDYNIVDTLRSETSTETWSILGWPAGLFASRVMLSSSLTFVLT